MQTETVTFDHGFEHITEINGRAFIEEDRLNCADTIAFNMSRYGVRISIADNYNNSYQISLDIKTVGDKDTIDTSYIDCLVSKLEEIKRLAIKYQDEHIN